MCHVTSEAVIYQHIYIWLHAVANSSSTPLALTYYILLIYSVICACYLIIPPSVIKNFTETYHCLSRLPHAATASLNIHMYTA